MILHVGDSITKGQGVAEDLRWAALVAERHDVEVGVTAVNGETTRMGLERFPKDVQDRRPEIITLQYGMNDCNRWETDQGFPRVSAGAFTANLREMIARARHFGTREVILSTNPRSLRPELYEKTNACYSELIRKVAEQTESTLCDIRAAFEGIDDDHLAALLQGDLLHLTPAGHELYADAIWPSISEALLTERVAA